jgi:hypothetical protein
MTDALATGTASTVNGCHKNIAHMQFEHFGPGVEVSGAFAHHLDRLELEFGHEWVCWYQNVHLSNFRYAVL